MPVAPVGPCGPGTPCGPVAPASPVGPVEPCRPRTKILFEQLQHPHWLQHNYYYKNTFHTSLR